MSWLCNPEAKASIHYIITRTGEIYQLVKEEDTAWHAGVINQPNWAFYSSIGFNPNRWTIGIEHENYPGDGEAGLTEAQYQASLALHKELCAKYNIPIDSEHIVGHYRVDSVDRVNCPGADFPWTRLFNDLKGVQTKRMENITIPVEAVKILAAGKEFTGVIINNRTYGVVREILEALGHTVAWDDTTKSVKIT